MGSNRAEASTPDAAKLGGAALPKDLLLGQASGLSISSSVPHQSGRGFFRSNDRGQPILRTQSGTAPAREIHSTTRMVLAFRSPG